MAFLLAAATFALFAPAIGFGFVNYDDGAYVFDNRRVLDGLNWPGLAYAFRTTDNGSWMPLTWLSYLAGTSLFGLRANGQHFINILLHAGSAALLFLALERMTKCFWRSALVAASFAVHPLRVESVVWIAERKDVLSLFFFAAGLLAYAAYAGKPDRKRLALVAVCLLCGLMSKPMLVTFPFVLLLLDHWPLGRTGKTGVEFRASFWPLCREKIPLLVVCVIFASLTFWSQSRGGAVVPVPDAPQLKALRVADNYTFYLGKFFWPAQLSVLYPATRLVGWEAGIKALGLLVVTGLAARWIFRLPWLVAGWLWFLGTLVPVIGLVQVGHISVADRYSYLPSIGLAIMLAWAAETLVQRKPRMRGVFTVVGAALLAICAATTRANLTRWQNSMTLLEDAIRKGDHEIAYNNLGNAYGEAGDWRRALSSYNRAIELNPCYPLSFNNRAAAHFRLGQADLAWADIRRCRELGGKPNAELVRDLQRVTGPTE
jgi:protein O-mannosyl-transferase